MEIIYLDSIDSTHKYLKDYIKKYSYTKPLAIIAESQTNGIGSRDNSWNGKFGNIFLSFVIDKELLPKDLPIQSASIYFSYILKEILYNNGSKVWIKWPNDFYLNDKKIGGTITNLNNNLIYCGIGLNLNFISSEYGILDIKIDKKIILKQYLNNIMAQIPWKQIFSKYLLEFNKSKLFKATINNQKISLKNTKLNDDGSIIIDNKRVYSLR
ncbi:MAG: biotin--[acetyl-CoA-carboxylase] ligase [Campylobacterota bacterium]|nr:biotin--[acetyl-CoA-carboxylase] ligase [Campylobacterota bacterium]